VDDEVLQETMLAKIRDDKLLRCSRASPSGAGARGMNIHPANTGYLRGRKAGIRWCKARDARQHHL